MKFKIDCKDDTYTYLGVHATELGHTVIIGYDDDDGRVVKMHRERVLFIIEAENLIETQKDDNQ